MNGYANTALFTAPAANDAVAYCQSLGDGWYLPARDELWELFDVYNGIGHADPDFASVVPDKLTEVEKAARAACNKRGCRFGQWGKLLVEYGKCSRG